MGEDLSDLIANILEFVVGGIFFLLSVLGVLAATGTVDVPALARSVGSANLGVAVLVLMYGVGVLVESASKAIFEVQLDRLTLRTKEFWRVERDFEVPGPADASDNIRRFRKVVGRLRVLVIRLRLGEGQSWVEPELDGDAGDGSLVKEGEPGHFTWHQRNLTVYVREKQRAALGEHAKLNASVESQLKRLRLERSATLSAAIGAFALWVAYGPAAGLGGVLLTFALGILVRTRMKRFCEAIARGYRMRRPEATSITDSASSTSERTSRLRWRAQPQRGVRPGRRARGLRALLANGVCAGRQRLRD